ncbi:MAG: hypothetical protein QMD80_08015 [archaeon]|nr:hypothetical protein [archaeon]
MEKNRRNRVALLGALLVTGLVLAGMGTALGVGEVLKFAGKEVSASVMTNEDGMYVLTIREDGKLVKAVTLPEGEYIWETSGHKLVLHKMTPEEMEKRQAEHEAETNKWIEIANKDSRVQELTNGEGIQYKGEKYNVVTAANSEDVVVLGVSIEDKWYKITIDLNSETVKSIEEHESPSMSVCYGPEGPIPCEKLPLHGPHAPR